MKVLLVGGGGREHALAWKLAQSPLLTELVVAPGNAGTRAMGLRHVPEVPADEKFDLVVVGPEAPLAAGLADRLDMPVFGPSARAAEIESSKSFAKDFMVRHGIPTARHRSFTAYDEAAAYVQAVDFPVVLKASGLAAGKGVLLPEPGQTLTALRELMTTEAGAEVVIEERLSGEEVSLMGFCDGTRVVPMRAVRDHKRLLDGDQGPNTGGMGVVSLDADVRDWSAMALEPAVRGLEAEGRPFVGVLYAGLMLTDDGPRVLEYNCRFGDPEAQVLLPMLHGDLLEICLQCVQGRLEPTRFWSGHAACVVMSAAGYPEKPRTGDVIRGLGPDEHHTLVFQAGTRLEDQNVVTAGGRVLGVTGLGTTQAEAIRHAYRRVAEISFDGAHYRKDIGLQLSAPQRTNP